MAFILVSKSQTSLKTPKCQAHRGRGGDLPAQPCPRQPEGCCPPPAGARDSPRGDPAEPWQSPSTGRTRTKTRHAEGFLGAKKECQYMQNPMLRDVWSIFRV